MISKNGKNKILEEWNFSKNETFHWKLTIAGREKNSSMTNGEQTTFAGVPWRKVLKVSLDRSFALLFSSLVHSSWKRIAHRDRCRSLKVCVFQLRGNHFSIIESTNLSHFEVNEYKNLDLPFHPLSIQIPKSFRNSEFNRLRHFVLWLFPI